MMRALGASDKYFYYTSSYRTTFSIQFRMTFKKLDLAAFRTAAQEALKRYPEFAYRPVVSGNRLFAEENAAPVVIAPAGDKIYHYGTEDTNGYLFYFTWQDNTVELTYYHGLTDVLGLMEFLRCMLACYARETGVVFTEEEQHEMDGLFREKTPPEAEQMTDPYVAAGDKDAVPEFSYPNPIGAFAIPGDYGAESEMEHGYSVTLSASAFLKKTKELGVSFIPLLSSIISGAVMDAFDTAGKPVISMVPANMRPLLNMRTAVNFSDGLIIPYEKEDAKLPLTERCAKFKSIMRAQVTENNFRHMAGAKAATVAAFEADPTPIAESARAKTQLPPAGGWRPITYAITYPGNLSLPAGLDRLLTDLSAGMWVRGNSVFGYTFRDKMQVLIKCRTEDDTWAKSVLKAFTDMGFQAVLEDCGQITCARIYVEELKQL